MAGLLLTQADRSLPSGFSENEFRSEQRIDNHLRIGAAEIDFGVAGEMQRVSREVRQKR